MPWKLPLADPIEYKGARFWFTNADAEFVAFEKHGRALAKAGKDADPSSPEHWAPLDALFMAGCIGWEDVEGLEFSEDAKRQIPIEDRVNIAGLVYLRLKGIDEKKVPLDGLLTCSSPPGGPSET